MTYDAFILTLIIIEKMSFYFRKHSLMADKSVFHEITLATTLIDNHSLITETVVYLNTYISDNHLLRTLRNDLLSPKFGSQKSALL